MPGPNSITFAQNESLSLQQFKTLFDDRHKVLDGDLRLRSLADGSQVLDKVNWGCSLRRAFNKTASANALPAESRAVRTALYNAILASYEGQEGQIDINRRRADLARDLLGIDVGGNADLDPLQGREQSVSEAALSRLTARNLVEKYTGVQMSRLVENVQKGDQRFFMNTNDKGEVVARRFGGENGLMLKAEQFNKLFTRAAELAAKQHPDEKSALEGLAAHYKSIFADKNASVEELQRFFQNDDDYVVGNTMLAGKKSRLDLDLQSVANKMKYIIDNEVSFVEKTGKGNRGANRLCVFQDRGFKDQYEKYQNRMSRNGDVDDMIQFEPEVEEQLEVQLEADEQPEAQQKKRTEEVRNLVADLFFNEDPVEVEFCGFSDGERIARVLFSHIKTVKDICVDFARGRDGADTSAGIALRALKGISNDLAEGFKRLIQGINTLIQLREGQTADDLPTSRFLNTAEKIIKKIEDLRFEDQIDDALKAFFGDKEGEKAKVYNNVCKDLCIDKDQSTDNIDLLKLVLESSLELPNGQGGGANHVAHRRMLAAGVRFSTLNPDQERFDYGAMLCGAGPSLLKRLQTFSMGEVNTEDMPDNMKTALSVITHRLQGGGKSVLKTQLYALFNELNDPNSPYEKIVVKKANLGAASIAQTLLCKLVKKGPPKTAEEVVIKLLRPEVTMELDAEFKGFELKLGQQKVGSDKTLKGTTLNFISSVKPELNFENETVNAMLAMFEKDLLALKFVKSGGGELRPSGITEENQSGFKTEEDLYRNLDKILGRNKDGVRKYSTEEILLKDPAILNNQQSRNAIVQKIADCYQANESNPNGLRNGLLDIAKEIFVKVSPNCIIMKKAEGEPMDGFLERLEKDLVAAGRNKAKLVNCSGKAVNAKKAMLQLGQELFNGLAYGKPPIYHGDLHGGNIFYDEESGKYTLIDHGKGFPLTKAEAESILECFALVSKPFENEKGVAEVGKRARGILEQYMQALIAERDAVNGDSQIDEETKSKRSEFLQSSIAFLVKAINYLKDGIKEGEVSVAGDDNEADEPLEKKIADAVMWQLKEQKGNPGGCMEGIAKVFKYYDLAVSDTLFGFFDTYAKLDKSLAMLDRLIEQAGQGGSGTIFDDEFSFGQIEKDYEDLADKDIDNVKVMGDFYWGLPYFIREEADMEVLLEEQQAAKDKAEMLILQNKVSEDEKKIIYGDEEKRNKAFSDDPNFSWDHLFANLLPHPGLYTELPEAIRINKELSSKLMEDEKKLEALKVSRSKLKDERDTKKRAYKAIEDKHDEIQAEYLYNDNVKGQVKDVSDEYTKAQEDYQTALDQYKKACDEYEKFSKTYNEQVNQLHVARETIEKYKETESGDKECAAKLAALRETNSIPLFNFLEKLNDESYSFTIQWNVQGKGDVSVSFADDLKNLVKKIQDGKGIPKTSKEPEGLDKEKLVETICNKYKFADPYGQSNDDFKTWVSDLVKYEMLRAHLEDFEANKDEVKVNTKDYETLEKRPGPDQDQALTNLAKRCKKASEQIRKLKTRIKVDFGSLNGLFLMSVADYVRNKKNEQNESDGQKEVVE